MNKNQFLRLLLVIGVVLFFIFTPYYLGVWIMNDPSKAIIIQWLAGLLLLGFLGFIGCLIIAFLIPIVNDTYDFIKNGTK